MLNAENNEVEMDCTKFKFFEKKEGNFIKILKGLEINNKLHKWISYNDFSKEGIDIPEGYIEREQKHVKEWFDFIEKYYCGNKTIITKSNKIKEDKHKDCKSYFIHDNGGRSFLVYHNVEKNKIYIYKIPNDVIIDDAWNNNDEKNKWMYSELVKKYEPIETFIGESPKNKMTEFSGGYGKKFIGNSILLKLNNNKYIYIGSEIFSFKSYYDIKRFVSPVGNNDVPYPYAEDVKNNFYLFLEPVVMKNIPKNTDAYSYYWEKTSLYSIQNENKSFKNITGFYILPVDIDKILKEYGKEKFSKNDIKKIVKEYDLDYSEKELDYLFYHEKKIDSETISNLYYKQNMYNLTYKEPSENYKRLTSGIGKYIYIKYGDEPIKKMTKPDYIQLLNEFSKTFNIKKFKDVITIHDRI